MISDLRIFLALLFSPLPSHGKTQTTVLRKVCRGVYACEVSLTKEILFLLELPSYFPLLVYVRS